MSRTNSLYLINRNLKATTLSDMLRVGSAFQEEVTVPDDGDSLALTSDGALAPSIIYPAANGGARAFALPTYSLLEVGGRYAISLKWIEEAQPDGPIARLTIGFEKTLPAPPPATSLAEIAHSVAAKLVYRVPVEDATGAGGGAWLSVGLGAIVVTADGGSQIVHDILTKADFDRLWFAMTDRAAECRLELTCFATMGRRTWRQLIPDRISLADQAQLLAKNGVLLSHVAEVTRAPVSLVGMGRRRIRTSNLVQPIDLDAVHPAPVGALAPLRMRATRAVDAAFALRAARGRLAGAAPARLSPQLARHMLHRLNFDEDGDFLDPRERPPLRPRPKRPIRVFTDPTGKPALIPVRAECTQTIPFTFDVAVNAYMFDVPGDLRPTTTRVLLRAEFDAGEGRSPVIYYQDSAFPSRFYYEPSEFRIPRSATPPYLPEIKLIFFDLIEEASDGDAEAAILYRVRMAYRAVPHLDRVILDRLRRKLVAADPDAEVTALMPEALALTLRLPGDAQDAPLAQTPRPDASIELDDGVIDELELSPTGLSAVITMLQTGGIDGQVTATLPGSSSTAVPVRLSLRETAGGATDRAFRGPITPGRVRVSLRNRLESPITISALYATPLDGAMAFPDAPAGLQLLAGGNVDLDYRIDPADARPIDLDPLLRFEVDADLDAILPGVMVNRGYASESFTVPVSIDADFFGTIPSGAGAPLSAVRVEFEHEVEIELDAVDPADDVTLRLPMLDWLLKRPSGARYRYRVVNLHGPDAATAGLIGAWIDGEGEGALAVVPASV
jgi:hypothetical protein